MSKTEVLNNNIKRISNLALFLYVISFYIVFWTFSSSDTDLIFNTKNVELPLIDQGSLLVDINTFAVIAPIILVGLHLLILYLSRKQIKMMLTCRDEELNDLNHSLISSAFTENVRYKRIVYYLVRFIYFYIPFIVLIYVFRRFSDLHLLNLTGFHFILIVIDYSLIKILGRELRKIVINPNASPNLFDKVIIILKRYFLFFLCYVDFTIVKIWSRKKYPYSVPKIRDWIQKIEMERIIMTMACWFMFLFIILKTGFADNLLGNTILRNVVPKIVVGYKFSQGEDVLKLRMPNESEKAQRSLDLKFCEFNGLELSNWIFDKANLKYAIFYGSHFDSVRFYNCKLDNIHIERCRIIKTLLVGSGTKIDGFVFELNTCNGLTVVDEYFSGSQFNYNVMTDMRLSNTIFENTKIINNDLVQINSDGHFKIIDCEIQYNNVLFSVFPEITFTSSLSHFNSLFASKLAFNEAILGSMFISCKSIASEIFFDIGSSFGYSNTLRADNQTVFYPADDPTAILTAVENVKKKLLVDFNKAITTMGFKPTVVKGYMGTSNVKEFLESINGNNDLDAQSKIRIIRWIEPFTISYAR